MTSVLQPDEAWNCDLARNCESLEHLHQALADAPGWQQVATIIADFPKSQDSWDKLLRTGKAEDAGSIAQNAVVASLHGAIAEPEAEGALEAFFTTVSNISRDNPSTAALVLGGTLSGMRSSDPSAASCSSHIIPVQMLQIWFRGSTLEAVINALIGGVFKNEIAAACAGWLCSLPDRVAQAIGVASSTSAAVVKFLEWLDTMYWRRLVAALISCICDAEHHEESALTPAALDLLARVAVRGNAAILAAYLCAKTITCSKFAVMGRTIAKLSEEHASAGRSLVCAILEASGAVLQSSSDLSAHCGGRNLLSVLRPALGHGLPIQQLLAVHIWQVPLGSQLPAAVVFALVDELMTGECCSDVCGHWFRSWADPTHRDVPAEQNLALRIARALRWPKLVSDRDHLHLLLQGVHHRLSSQAKETRLYGMAVAETMASCWRSDENEKNEEQLQFDNFDRDDPSVIPFRLVNLDFKDSDDLPVEGSNSASKILLELLGGGAGGNPGLAGQLEDNVENVTVHQEDPEGESETVWPADSDDEDEDHPLCGVPPLSPLNAVPDTCSDLLLVQPPHFLRGAYEMLLGPLKTPLTPLSEEVHGKPGQAPEPPATARARLLTTLAEFPKLIQCGSEELPRLAAPISSRLLRLEAVHDVDDLKLKVLVSLLVADSSRRNAVQNLIAEFGSEDMPLISRRMILDALAASSRELSGSQDVERSGPSKPALGTVGKTRRFASATQIPPSTTNRFASEARHFILPLVARWRKPAGEASTVAEFLHSLGVMLESAGRACPEREQLARSCSEPAMEGLSHTELLVRRCSLFVLSRIVLVGCEEVLLELPILMQLEACPFVESDDTCRRMAAGLVACLSKRPLS